MKLNDAIKTPFYQQVPHDIVEVIKQRNLNISYWQICNLRIRFQHQ